jgi:translation initiation factor IF-2
MRVYELAKELGVQSKELLTILNEGGFPAASHMAVVSDEARALIDKHFAHDKKQTTKDPVQVIEEKKQTAKIVQPAKHKEPVVVKREEEKIIEKPAHTKPLPIPIAMPVVEEEPVNTPVLSLRPHVEIEIEEDSEIKEQERVKRLLQTTGYAGLSIGQQQGPRRRKRRRPRPVVQQEVKRDPVSEVTIKSSMPLFEVADLFVKTSGDLIMALLKKGMSCNRNQVLTVDLIRELGNNFGITVHVKHDEQTPESLEIKKAIKSSVRGGDIRWPVVVVMGHVDHGKTTLLDYIRKMNVAATEKGGITQHIRAWEVDSTHGKIVFLDTPGHEAFSYLRERGSRVTDIAILVVAVDDGIKPQTIEAINHAKEAGLPIVVAVNKIDKVQSPSAMETIKRQLAQYELLPEEWGGQTIIVPISAKTGQGVEELLEMIVLQSQMMDLKADTKAAAKAFILESHVEKGFGPVATVIVKEGVLKQGDYFVCGAGTGKVRILVNSTGQKITQALPSTPVQVVGFDTFTGIGDWLTVVPQNEYSKARSQKGVESAVPAQVAQTAMARLAQLQGGKSKSINLIIKTDTRGSKEAIMGSIDKLIKEHKEIKCPISIITSAIGDISESDIDLAHDTQSLILGLHVRVEKNAQMYAKERGVDIQTYQIIYELIDSLRDLLLSKKEVVMTWKKVGEAVVKKVFDIKGVGIIAGCYLRDGVLSRGNKVACMRGGKQVGEGRVVTLQRDRKAVKEIHAGFECGFSADGFTEWQEGDTVLCFAETKAE